MTVCRDGATSGQDEIAVDRRAVLRGGATAALVAASVAACGGEPASGSQAAAPTPGTALVSASDVPVGGGVILPKAQMVVTQPTPGEFKGFSFVCTHAGCPVTQVTNGVIICPCHGSRFSVATGAPEPGSPATKPLAARPVADDGGEVVAA